MLLTFCVCLLCAFEGAFFVPYVIFFVCCGIPVFFLETALGQFTSEGGITCWRKVCPLFEGEKSLSTQRALRILREISLGILHKQCQSTNDFLHMTILNILLASRVAAKQPVTLSLFSTYVRYRLRNTGDRSSSQRVLHRDPCLGHLLPLQLLYHRVAMGRLWTLLEYR